MITTPGDLVGCAGGGLWLCNEQGYFYLAEEKSLGFSTDIGFSKEDQFIRFLNEKQWVIDSCEFESNPEIYDEVGLTQWMENQHIWLIIPLLQQN
ncbi:hypothetical protein [Bathymodiolus japonicus methanotrophic gill symbiont]|uniref:hypothetical protein n=1 Tax=Bathymodiolus japonicus methanotrophic gill symbiont TaxID=113269 RepID=UPI001C8DD4A9|nr:hypothetical protein [Bathymodiolus japonicus methanotrophic gill symbiont]